MFHRQCCVLRRRKRLDFIIHKRSGFLLLALSKFMDPDGRLSLVSSTPVNHDCTWRRPGMCSGASTAAPPNYKRVVQFSLSAVSKARFLIFLTPEADTKHKPTLRNIADEQTPGFISLMIRAGGRRAVVNTVMNPMGVHAMRGISTLAKKLQASPGGLYSVWSGSHQVMSHTRLLCLASSAATCCGRTLGRPNCGARLFVHPANKAHTTCQYVSLLFAATDLTENSDITKFTAPSYRYRW